MALDLGQRDFSNQLVVGIEEARFFGGVVEAERLGIGHGVDDDRIRLETADLIQEALDDG